MLSRREFLKAAGLLALWPAGCTRHLVGGTAVYVNDVHSQLNLTRLSRIVAPDSLESIQRLVCARHPLCIAGGRHAMGGQQFATDAVLLDTMRLNRILSFNPEHG